MTSSYRDPNVTAALAYQAEQEQRRKAQEQPNLLDIAGRTALGLGVAALAGAGIRGVMRRNAVRPISVEDLGATAGRAEENVRRAARSAAPPPPSRPAPPAGVGRQQAAEEFTRQARAERPVGIQQVNIEDLGPTWYTPTAAENKATLSWLDNVVLPTEQALTRPRLPGVTQVDLTDFSPQFRSYGQVPQVAEQVVSEVKALPPARTQSTDFLRNQLGSRGYIEQSILDRVAEQSAGDLIDEVTAFSNKEARSELARQGASIQSQERKNLWNLVNEIQNETLVDKQQTRTGFNVDQAINALDAAEDQQTGRVKIQLQRNEDLDLGQVEVLEDIADEQRTWMMEQDEPINRVAAQLPDGRPLDQAEGRLIPGDERYEDRLLKTIYQQELEARPPALTKEDMERNIQNSLNRGLRVAAQLPDGRPLDQAEGALSFAQNRMQEIREAQEAKGYRGLGVEREMLQGAEGTRLKQASELYAATGDPNVLSLISEAPSLPITVQPKGQQLVTAQSLKGDAPAELKTSSLYSPFKARVANTNKQEDVDTRMTNRISGLGATRESIPKTIINPAYAALEEETNMAMYGMQQGSASAANIYNRNRQIFREGKAPPREIVNPEYLQLSRQIDEAESVRGEARNIIQTKKSDIEQFPSIYKVADLQEGVRAFYQQTPEGQILPETLEVRTGRRAVPAGTVEKPASGSSIRGLAGAVEMESYIPEERELASTAAQEMAMGPKIGMDPQRRETMVSSPVRWNSLIHSPAQRTPEGFVYTEEAMRKPTAVLSKSFGTRPSSAPDIARASVDASETIRRLQSSNAPGAQEQLNQYIQSLRTKKI